jgi:hypothetical protein
MLSYRVEKLGICYDDEGLFYLNGKPHGSQERVLPCTTVPEFADVQTKVLGQAFKELVPCCTTIG